MIYQPLAAYGPEENLFTCSECECNSKSAYFSNKRSVHTRVTRSSSFPRQRRNNKITAFHPLTQLDLCNDWCFDLDMARRTVNYYAILGLPISASRSEIHAAYTRHIEEAQQRCHDTIESSSSDEASAISPLPSATAFEALHALMTMTRSPLIVPRKLSTNISKSVTSSYITSLHCKGSLDFIIEINKIEDAFRILAHPVKKKVYDLAFCQALYTYEIRRIARDTPRHHSRAQSERRARRWRMSLEIGQDLKNEYDEAEFGRVGGLGCYSRWDFSLITASMACGEVVASFIEGMDL